MRIAARLNAHIHEPGDTPKSRWIGGLLAEGMRPLIEVIEEAEPENWIGREVHWIAHYRAAGAPLFNIAEGGHASSESARRKLSALNAGRKLSAETKAKIGAASKATPRTPEWRARISASQTKEKARVNCAWCGTELTIKQYRVKQSKSGKFFCGFSHKGLYFGAKRNVSARAEQEPPPCVGLMPIGRRKHPLPFANSE